MKLSPHWIRDFVDLTVDDRRLADDLTNAGIAVEGISGEGKNAVFEMEIGTNRPDAMNHYGVAREAAAIYGLPLETDSAEAARSEAGDRTQADPESATSACPLFPSKSKIPRVARDSPPAYFANVSVKPSPPADRRAPGTARSAQPSTTPPTPPITRFGRWANPLTFSILICSKAARS